MSRALVCELYVMPPWRHSHAIPRVVDALLQAGFVYESEPGQGGRAWDHQHLEWLDHQSLADALTWDPASTNWAIELTKTMVSGEPVEVTFSAWRQSTAEREEDAVLRYGLIMPMPSVADAGTLVEEFVAWSTFLAALIQPAYGWGGSSLGLFNREVTPIVPEDIRAVILQPLEWLNIFGPPYIERLGLDALLSAPAWRVEVLAYPAVAVVLSPHPDTVREDTAQNVARQLGLHVPGR